MSRVDVDRPAGQIVGRETELAELARFVAARAAEKPQVLVFHGDAGAGKTTLWEAAVELARGRGLRVLEARPNGAEAKLSFAGLTDLLEDVDFGGLPGLPAPQRRALEVALLRAEPAGPEGGPEPRAIATGLLNGLRAMSADAPLLVAIDDVQWLDLPSADALAFAARRLEGHDVRFLLAKRSGSPTVLDSALAGESDALPVAALSLGATRRLLYERLALSPPRRIMQQLYDTAAGNPLFALELGRVLVERGIPEIGEDMPVPDALEDLLRARVADLPHRVRRLLVALALEPGLRLAQLASLRDPETVEDAVERGILLVDGERVRASHPLVAAAARKQARASERRKLHGELAGVVATDSLQARHSRLRQHGRTRTWHGRSRPRRAARRCEGRARRPSSWPSTRCA